MGRELRLILAAAGLAACVYFATWPFGTNARDNDFLHFYAGARLSGSPVTLYSVEEARSVMASVQPGAVFRPVVRPPFYYSMIRFLGWLPYPRALAVWQILSLCCLAAFAILWERWGCRRSRCWGCSSRFGTVWRWARMLRFSCSRRRWRPS
jgi:hypothetical protein